MIKKACGQCPRAFLLCVRNSARPTSVEPAENTSGGSTRGDGLIRGAHQFRNSKQPQKCLEIGQFRSYKIVNQGLNREDRGRLCYWLLPFA